MKFAQASESKQYFTRLRTFSALLLLMFAIVFSSCAPAAGRAVVKYNAPAEDLISAIAEFAVTQRPGDGYNFYSVQSINDKFVSLKADTTGGISFFFGSSTVILSFTALEQDNGVTSIAASNDGGSDEQLDAFINLLDRTFERGDNNL